MLSSHDHASSQQRPHLFSIYFCAGFNHCHDKIPFRRLRERKHPFWFRRVSWQEQSRSHADGLRVERVPMPATFLLTLSC